MGVESVNITMLLLRLVLYAEKSSGVSRTCFIRWHQTNENLLRPLDLNYILHHVNIRKPKLVQQLGKQQVQHMVQLLLDQ